MARITAFSLSRSISPATGFEAILFWRALYFFISSDARVLILSLSLSGSKSLTSFSNRLVIESRTRPASGWAPAFFESRYFIRAPIIFRKGARLGYGAYWDSMG